MADIEITTCGGQITIPDIYAANFAEETEVRDRWWHVADGETVLDIGASLGTYTLPALARGAAVLAADVLEMGPLLQTARLNGLDDKLVTVQSAVGDTGGYPEWLLAGVAGAPESYPGIPDCKEWTTVDDLVSGYIISRVDWMKIDTEGGEVPVLRGASATLGRDHPKLLIEEHSHMPHVAAQGNADTLRELLTGYGYAVDVMQYHGRELWYCEAHNG